VSICAILHNRRQLRGRITRATNRRFGVVIYTAARRGVSMHRVS
jgi:hypothetical protein